MRTWLREPAHSQGYAFLLSKVAGCNADNSILGPQTAGAGTVSCSRPGTFLNSGTGSFAKGILHASSSMLLTNFGYADGVQLCNILCSSRGDVTVAVGWSEKAAVSNPNAAFLRLKFHIDGTVNAAFTSFTAPCGVLSVGAPLTVGGNGFASTNFGTANPQIHTTASASCINGASATGPLVRSYNDTYFATIAVVNGFASFSYSTSAGILASLWSPNTQGVFSANATADFGNTVGVTGYDVFDAAGNDISAGSNVEFENGLQLMTTVPEPSTVVLLLGGLCAIAGARFRRRGATRR